MFTCISFKKKTLNNLNKFNLIPKKFLGIKTDLIKYNSFKFNSPIINPLPKVSTNYFTKRKRPIQGGYSIGLSTFHFAGTLGAIVFDNKNNTPYILGCNHTLAREKKSLTPVLQPSFVDGGVSSDKIAYFYKTIKRKEYINGSRFIIFNYVDAAIAQLNPYIEYSKEIYGVGEIKGISKPKLGLEVRKVGRTTGYTIGTISTINTIVSIETTKNVFLVFKKQIVTTAMGTGGDSGSILVDNNNNAIGLLMSGDTTETTFNPIDKVCKLLNVHF